MRHLYIIGNGFDLAHGLKTSYRDFFIWYLRKTFRLIYDSQSELIVIDDDLLTLKRSPYYPIKEYDDIEQVINDINSISVFKDRIKEIGQSTHSYNISYLPLFQKICEKDGWADIEKVYYDLLLESITDKGFTAIKKLNQSLRSLKAELEKYLNEVIVDKIDNFNINDVIFEIESIIYPGYTKIPIEDIMIINFNYTNLIGKYSDLRYGKFLQVDIHGQLNNPENPIIFGYGDEKHERYNEIENTGFNEYLKYMKSIGYLKTENYHHILNFINGGEYYAHVIGHSLGLSDRLLLNTILENDNCKKIEIHYYKKSSNRDNSEELGINLYRHFNDKAKLREKVISSKDAKSMNS